VTGPEHYEVELREVTHENSVTSGLRITGERDRPGSVRIVRVTEEGERQVVEAS
jgi:hypothetical protein